jgi:predicted nucleic acid-binding protein
MGLVVPDASLILKWVIAGEDRSEEEAALKVLQDWLNEKETIILPSIWFYEVSNLLGLKKPKQAYALMEVLLDYDFEEARITKELCRLALEIMSKLKVTFYDAIYHAVAIKKNGTFITADRQYFRKASPLGYIKLLGS